MRLFVNLASRPFVELRPFFLRLRILMATLAVAGVVLAIVAHMFSARAQKQQLELDRLRNQTIAVQQSKLHTEQRLRDPVNARVLDRAHFLNTVFLRKSFSWTAVMMDLEGVLPNGVQVTSIEPQVSPDGSVVIRLRVAGERANAVQLVRNLERSRRFLQPRLAGEASQNKENTGGASRPANGTLLQGPPTPAGVEFDILADYNPLPPGETYASGRVRAASAPSGALKVPVIRPAPVPGKLPSANLRNGYPSYGVRLQAKDRAAAPSVAAEPPQSFQGSPR